VKSSGSLSSGQVYAAFAGLDADFSWQISGDFSFSLKPDQLPELTARENILDDADLRKVEERLAEGIENFILLRLRAYADGEDEKKMESITLAGSFPELDSEIQKAFPEIENLVCTIQAVQFPDYALYQSIKYLYHEYLAQQTTVLMQKNAREAEKRIETRLRLDELARYGELLTQYPVLLQYLALEKNLSD
jgi:hypothetical protein